VVGCAGAHREKRRTEIFSPIVAVASLTTVATVFSGSLMYGCSISAMALTSLATRPATILGLRARGAGSCSAALAL